MPYGIPEETQSDEAWMERCVAKVMGDGKSKESAIRICKAMLMRDRELSKTRR